MQNPGSDAGVFVLVSPSHLPAKTLRQYGFAHASAAPAQSTLMPIATDAHRNVTLKKIHRARRDIPVMHTALQIYDGVC
jgi:hypothetical protein